MVGVLLPKGMLGATQQQPVLGGSPMLGGQPSLDFLTRIPAAIPQATGWQPGTTPQWVPDWLRNLSTANTAQTQATQQDLAALPPRYAMTPQDINMAMSLGMSGGTLGDIGEIPPPGETGVWNMNATGTNEEYQALVNPTGSEIRQLQRDATSGVPGQRIGTVRLMKLNDGTTLAWDGYHDTHDSMQLKLPDDLQNVGEAARANYTGGPTVQQPLGGGPGLKDWARPMARQGQLGK